MGVFGTLAFEMARCWCKIFTNTVCWAFFTPCSPLKRLVRWFYGATIAEWLLDSKSCQAIFVRLHHTISHFPIALGEASSAMQIEMRSFPVHLYQQIVIPS
jgi:hypothetical protein